MRDTRPGGRSASLQMVESECGSGLCAPRRPTPRGPSTSVQRECKCRWQLQGPRCSIWSRRNPAAWAGSLQSVMVSTSISVLPQDALLPLACQPVVSRGGLPGHNIPCPVGPRARVGSPVLHSKTRGVASVVCRPLSSGA